jgi:hypothetical protein
VICANWQPDTIDQRVQEFLAYLNSLSPLEALIKAGVLSKTFWLRGVSHYF